MIADKLFFCLIFIYYFQIFCRKEFEKNFPFEKVINFSLHLVETSLDSRNHMYFVVTWQQICWNLNARPESNKVSVNKFTLQINSIASFCFDESKTSRYISLNTLAFIIFILYQLWSFQLSPVFIT